MGGGVPVPKKWNLWRVPRFFVRRQISAADLYVLVGHWSLQLQARVLPQRSVNVWDLVISSFSTTTCPERSSIPTPCWAPKAPGSPIYAGGRTHGTTHEDCLASVDLVNVDQALNVSAVESAPGIGSTHGANLRSRRPYRRGREGRGSPMLRRREWLLGSEMSKPLRIHPTGEKTNGGLGRCSHSRATDSLQPVDTYHQLGGRGDWSQNCSPDTGLLVRVGANSRIAVLREQACEYMAFEPRNEFMCVSQWSGAVRGGGPQTFSAGSLPDVHSQLAGGERGVVRWPGPRENGLNSVKELPHCSRQA